MAAALQLLSEVNVGDEVVIKGTGFANSTAYTVNISKDGNNDVKFQGTTSGGGAVDTTNELTITAGSEGIIYVSVTDGTSTVKGQIPVWRVG